MMRSNRRHGMPIPRPLAVIGFSWIIAVGFIVGPFPVAARLWAEVENRGLTSPARPQSSGSREELEAVLASAPKQPAANDLRVLNILLLADVKDHGPGEHDYPLWQEQWQTLLANNPSLAPKVNVATARQWPSREQFLQANLLVMYCYPGTPKGRTFSPSQIEQLADFIARGGGFVPVHSATYTVGDLSQEDGKRLLAATGLMFAKSMLYRHGSIELKIADATHPICLGLPQTLHFVDEPYWPPTGDLGQVQILATSDESLVPDAENRKPQPMFWTHTHGKGRVFGCALGHYSATFDNPYFRILLLRGMAWAACELPYRFDPLVLVSASPHESQMEAIRNTADSTAPTTIVKGMFSHE